MADGSLFPIAPEMKRCTKCSETKPLLEFNRCRRGRLVRSDCKRCQSAATIRWQRENKEKYAAKSKRWRESNNDKVRQYGRTAWGKMAVAKKAARAAKQRTKHLAAKYGITPAEWDRLYAAQGGVCALCRIPGRVGKHGKLAVDHCHETGRVRGLLCVTCNVALGVLGDTPEKMERIMAYVKGPK